MFHQFNVHAQIAALTEGEVRAHRAVRGMSEVRFARRIAMQARRKQTRELGL